MDSEQMHQGWVPVEVPVTLGGIGVRWMDFSSVEICEPFFRQTLKKMADLKSPVKTTSLHELLARGGSIAPVDPACLIFHVSRCGSTLLSNGLRAAGNCVALSEPKIITDCFHPCYGLPGSAQKLRDAMMKSVVKIFATYKGPEQRVVIKLASWNLLTAGAIRTLWPRVPCIFVIREPLEVVVSNMKPGGWLAFRSDPTCAAELLHLDVMEVLKLSDAEFCIRMVRRLYEAALAAVDDSWTVLDYTMLDVATVRDIAQSIGLPCLDEETLRSTFRVDAKDPDANRVFEDDCAVKRAKAAQLIHCPDTEQAEQAYRSLLSLARSKRT